MFEEATSERNPSGVPKREKETVRCEQGRTRSIFDTKHGTSGVWWSGGLHVPPFLMSAMLLKRRNDGLSGLRSEVKKYGSSSTGFKPPIND